MVHFNDLDPQHDQYATQVVERLLQAALSEGASDIHIEKTGAGVQLRWRVHGNLVDLGTCLDGKTTNILGRIKALARLVTYRHDIPQEGRIVWADRSLEARVGTLPTLHGERAVIRLVNQRAHAWLPEQLGLSPAILSRLQAALEAPSGVILITGPAGAGKTTTAYACLRYLLGRTEFPRSLVALEDPIEAELAGVSQSQINPAIGYTWSDGLKALLRQDPEVMLVGEIRDAETAAIVFQAAMTGQLVISTMHARTVSDALRRLLDMHVPVHHLRSALDFLLCQRLAPARCMTCQGQATEQVSQCLDCGGKGFCGRTPQAELLPVIEGELAEAIQAGAGSIELQRAAHSQGMQPLAILCT